MVVLCLLRGFFGLISSQFSWSLWFRGPPESIPLFCGHCGHFVRLCSCFASLCGCFALSSLNVSHCICFASLCDCITSPCSFFLLLIGSRCGHFASISTYLMSFVVILHQFLVVFHPFVVILHLCSLLCLIILHLLMVIFHQYLCFACLNNHLLSL